MQKKKKQESRNGLYFFFSALLCPPGTGHVIFFENYRNSCETINCRAGRPLLEKGVFLYER